MSVPASQLDRTGTPANPQRVVATFQDYAAAQKAVDYLSDEKFPVEHAAIVGRGLKFVEQVTGRLNWGRALLNGLASGASTGLFIGLLLALFIPNVDEVVGPDGAVSYVAESGLNWSLVLWGLLIGAVIGAILNAIAYAMTAGKRDFTSVGAMRAETYDVLIDADHADKAESVLAGMPAAS